MAGRTRRVVSVLGPVRIIERSLAGDHDVAITTQQTRLLGALAATANQTVETLDLIEAVWQDRDIAHRDTLKTQLTPLRHALAGAATIEHRRGLGYRLLVPSEALDSARFAAAMTPHADVATLLDALALWRGDRAFANCDHERTDAAAWHLDDLRERAVLLLADASSAAGAASPQALSLLAERFERQPDRDDLAVRLVTLLATAGRQGDALDAAEQHRNALAERGAITSPAFEERVVAILQHRLARLPPNDRFPSAPSLDPHSSAHPPLHPPPQPLPARPGVRLFGRGGELEALLADPVDRSGAPEVVGVRGPSGYGKTTLVAEALHRWDGAARYGRFDPDLHTPLQAWHTLIGDIVDLSRHRIDAHTAAPAHARQALIDDIATAIDKLSVTDPVMLVLDDAHDADDLSLIVLRHVIARTYSAPVRLVLVERTDAVEPVLLADARSEARRRSRYRDIVVGRLDDVSAAAALQHRAPGLRNVTELCALADGNPYAIAVLGEAARDDVADMLPAAMEVGASALGDLYARRLAALGASARTVIDTAALVGGGIDEALLAAVCAAQPAEIDAALKPGVLREVDGGEDTYEISHPLLRRYLVQCMPPASRRRAHRRIAEAMEADRRWTEHRPGAIAEHFLNAGSAYSERAAPYLAAAAQVSYRLLAFEDALRQADRVIELTEHTGLIAEMHVLAARALGALGDLPGSRLRFEIALAASRAASRDDLIAASVCGVTGEWYVNHDVRAEDLALLDTIAAELTDPLARSAVLARWALLDRAGAAERASRAEEAMALAETAEDPFAIARAAHTLIYVEYLRGTVRDRLRHAERCRQAATAAGSPETRVSAAANLVTCYIELDQLADATREVAECRAAQLAAPRPLSLWWLASMESLLACAEERYDDALRCAREGFDLGKRIGHADAAPWFTMQQFAILRPQGRLAEIVDRLARGAALPGMHASWRAAAAIALWETGDFATAAPLIDTLTEPAIRDHTFAGTCALVHDARALAENGMMSPPTTPVVYGVACALVHRGISPTVLAT